MRLVTQLGFGFSKAKKGTFKVVEIEPDRNIARVKTLGIGVVAIGPGIE
jgi:hypothetical protein